MSLNQLIDEHVTTVFLNTDHFAETMRRYICGDSDNVTNFVGIVTVDGTNINDARGRGFDHAATLVLSSDIQMNVGDAILHGEDRYEVKTVGAAEHGMRTCQLNRYQPEVRGGKVFRNGDL